MKGDAQLLVLAAEMDKAGIDKVKKSVEQVGEKVDKVKRGVSGLDKRLLAVQEASKSVN